MSGEEEEEEEEEKEEEARVQQEEDTRLAHLCGGGELLIGSDDAFR